ncbi:hypothetical protein F5X68DRAFT_234130 [Plectosphaerella plurivora]|uniref:Secreted protein n=1 Tax=Plectosphaerella plurivora TaxID=936078 RepID=A0A9P9A9B3_9PEZI|nr:hypothetical protein F5X68DRAFT_234130 [Plectosphaerella plurivora]
MVSIKSLFFAAATLTAVAEAQMYHCWCGSGGRRTREVCASNGSGVMRGSRCELFGPAIPGWWYDRACREPSQQMCDQVA